MKRKKIPKKRIKLQKIIKKMKLAQTSWSETPITKRSNILFKFKSLIEKNFDEGLFRDISDIFGKNNSQRQFFSVPGGSIPNDQGSFAKWLYSTPPTCKEGNGLQCAANQYGVSGLRGSETSKAG